MASTDRAATIRAIFVAYMANDRKVVEDVLAVVLLQLIGVGAQRVERVRVEDQVHRRIERPARLPRVRIEAAVEPARHTVDLTAARTRLYDFAHRPRFERIPR